MFWRLGRGIVGSGLRVSECGYRYGRWARVLGVWNTLFMLLTTYVRIWEWTGVECLVLVKVYLGLVDSHGPQPPDSLTYFTTYPSVTVNVAVAHPDGHAV